MSREGERQIDYPGTTVKFILDKKSEVKLSIYNIPGAEITVLLKGILESVFTRSC
ncbi:MAG: hypothetical protein IH880_05455 [Candidatus Marinimicrobia bacterium]|nr:hypothetical protein [Candidatus Neomarinimicrobiota bacterium]